MESSKKPIVSLVLFTLSAIAIAEGPISGSSRIRMASPCSSYLSGPRRPVSLHGQRRAQVVQRTRSDRGEHLLSGAIRGGEDAGR